MELHLQQPDFEYSLRGADGSSALVNDRRLVRSFLIAPDQLVEDWPVETATALRPADLDVIIAMRPELVVLGTGSRQTFPPQEAMAALLSRGIGLEAMTNTAAAGTYQVLASEGRRVVAGFILGG